LLLSFETFLALLCPVFDTIFRLEIVSLIIDTQAAVLSN
jgi:hypothetical protein